MRLYLAIISTAILLTGCLSTTPTGNIEAFGVSAAGVTEKIDSVISDYKKANIHNEIVKMSDRNITYDADSLKSIKKIIIRDADVKDFALFKANKALNKYAKSLAELAKAGSRDEIALAAAKLSTSLKDMNTQYKTLAETEEDLLSDEKSSMLSRIVAEVTTFYAERKRAKALKGIILATDEQIQTICKTINEQLLKGTIETRLYTMKETELNAYFNDYNQDVKKKSFAAKKKELDLIYSKYLEMQSSAAIIAQAQKAITSVMNAHSKLKTELEKDRFHSKEIFKAIGEIKKIHNSFDDLEELMMSCETEIVSDAKKGIICKEKAK